VIEEADRLSVIMWRGFEDKFETEHSLLVIVYSFLLLNTFLCKKVMTTGIIWFVG